MKKIYIIAVSIIMVLSLVGCSQTIQGEHTEMDIDEAVDFGAKGALENQELNIEDMLNYAIQDEYLARQEYELIMDEYGEQKPFSNIIKAEEYHIEMLKEIYEIHGYEIPEDSAIDHIVLPESLEQAFDIGVEAEIKNIAMYELFLTFDLPDDIKEVFIELRDGSKNHLAAFEKGVRGGGNNK